MKKTYIIPAVEALEVRAEEMIATSIPTSDTTITPDNIGDFDLNSNVVKDIIGIDHNADLSFGE